MLCILLGYIMRLCPYMLVALAFVFDTKGLVVKNIGIELKRTRLLSHRSTAGWASEASLRSLTQRGPPNSRELLFLTGFSHLPLQPPKLLRTGHPPMTVSRKCLLASPASLAAVQE